MFQMCLYDPLNTDNAVKKVHCSFLGLLAGLRKYVHKESLYEEFGRCPDL